MAQSQDQYKILANKYRPDNFDHLVGQEVLIRTLSNAIKNNRIANAFLLTGIRGVGKTTTARIIAKALNCTGKAQQENLNINPCGECKNCINIKSDRHLDVIEMDAASHTGVDDAREIIENSKYLPNSAKYKIYIIDEVHMLSKSAFNALLKTLEEPPPHVKFILATTEIRKIPVTILSRCQRFDLRRVEHDQMQKHLKNIADKENIEIDDEALSIIANSSEGSVRDALSLLDQAILQSKDKIDANIIYDMMGLADNSKIIELFSCICEGNIGKSLELMQILYNYGADEILILKELLDINHIITKLKILPNYNLSHLIGKDNLDKAKILSEKLDIMFLSRSWQALLKGIQDVKIATNSFNAAEMVLIRLTHMSNLPSPSAIIDNFNKNKDHYNTDDNNINSQTQTNINNTQNIATPSNQINNFKDILQLFKDKKEILFYSWLTSEVKLVNFKIGEIELNISNNLPVDFTNKLSSFLQEWTNMKWIIKVSDDNSGSTIHEQQIKKAKKDKEELYNHSDIKEIMNNFPGSTISNIN